MSNKEDELIKAIKNAEKLHGHLGPFLVIGVRMGNIAKGILDLNREKNTRLQATVKIPFLTPFSCVLDGIQATTQCTVGNQKLRIENSQREIIAAFKLQNSDRALRISVNLKIIDELMDRISEGASNEELAWEIANMPESRLFATER